MIIIEITDAGTGASQSELLKELAEIIKHSSNDRLNNAFRWTGAIGNYHFTKRVTVQELEDSGIIPPVY